jgi:hypothetical protein
MYEITYGSKYDESLDTAEIAKLVRKDIKAEVKAGNLPSAPVKYSVRIERFAGGSSINIFVKGYDKPASLWTEFGPFGQPGYVRTDEATAIIARLDSILNAYNFDGSEVQVDYFHVNFYGHATFGMDCPEDDNPAGYNATYAKAHNARIAT